MKIGVSSVLLLLSLTVSAQDFMMQGWYWDYASVPCTGGVTQKWATELNSNVSAMANAGFTYVWLPPASKGGHECSVGYDPKDLYDLGDFGATRLGTRSQLTSLITAINNSGMEAVADVVYNHRDGGDYEDNPAVKTYILDYEIPTNGCNNGITPYPVNGKARWRLPLGGSSGNGAGDYYLKLESASENSGFYGRDYNIRFETNTVGNQNLATLNESEPNGGGDCNPSEGFDTIIMGRDMNAKIDDGTQCGIDEFYLNLSAADFNASGDFLYIYIEQINGDGTGIDIKPRGFFSISRSLDVLSELTLQTRTDFKSMPSGLGEMDYTNFKPNGTDPTCLEGDWDFPYFFFDVDQRTASTQTVYNEWTEWLLTTAGFQGGLRMDAVKHFDPSMVTSLLNYLSGEGIEPGMVVGEIFDTNAGTLNTWVGNVQNGLTANVDVRAFDFNLRQSLKDACDQHFFSSFYDVRNVFNAGMEAAGASSFSVVTFINNHDYRSSNEPVQDDPILGYAYILTNNKVGLPCVFYPDFFGLQPPNHPATNMQTEITELMGVHEDFIFGASNHDYLNAFGTGYASHYNSGNANQCLIFQIKGGGSGGEENVIVAINFDDERLQVDHQVNTTDNPVGSQFEDVLGNSAFPFAVVSANSPNGVSNSVYIDLPARSYSVWVRSAILPAELTDFQVEKQNYHALLNWETAQEEQLAYFQIERSDDGKDFIEIGQQTAIGNAQNRNAYQFTDQQLTKQGTSYYRLRMVDVDGSETLSPVRSLKWGNVAGRLWPNPAIGLLHYEFSAKAKHCLVYNSGGQLMNVSSQLNEANFIDVSAWNPGLYQLVFELEDGSREVFRIVR